MDPERIEAEETDEAVEAELPSDKVADLVEYVVCGLVDDVDSVSLDVTDGDDGTLIEVSCDEAVAVAPSRPFARSPVRSASASAPLSTWKSWARAHPCTRSFVP